MKIAIMQPYFLPYLGYWQLIHNVDIFVIYNDVNFIKQGWINRNKILINNRYTFFTIPLKKFQHTDKINEIYISPSEIWKSKMLKMLEFKYRKAPFFYEIFPIIEEIILLNTDSLSDLVINQIKIITTYLKINSIIKISSIDFPDTLLQGEERLIHICQKQNASIYINPEGGKNLYSPNKFSEKGIDIQFLKYTGSPHSNSKTEHLSIIDFLMCNSKKSILNMICNDFEIISHV
jgi:hypothetical protein